MNYCINQDYWAQREGDLIEHFAFQFGSNRMRKCLYGGKCAEHRAQSSGNPKSPWRETSDWKRTSSKHSKICYLKLQHIENKLFPELGTSYFNDTLFSISSIIFKFWYILVITLVLIILQWILSWNFYVFL